MPGLLARWILSSVIRSGLVFESEAIDSYRALRQRLRENRACDESFENSLCHLLEEEETHRRVLTDVAAGRITLEELERLLAGHVYEGMDRIVPLSGEDLARWEPALSTAVEQEEKTWVFYGNLQRMSKIPIARKAFSVLARMEQEHVRILRRILGRPEP